MTLARLPYPLPMEIRNWTQKAGKQATSLQRRRKALTHELTVSPPWTLNKLWKIFPQFPLCEMDTSPTYTGS